MGSNRELLEKLLALANDKCNHFESAAAYRKYIELKEKVGDNFKEAEEKEEWNLFDPDTWTEAEREEWCNSCWSGKKTEFDRREEFWHTAYKVDGGYLIRRFTYISAMESHFVRHLHDFGNEFEGARKYALKQINFFANLAMQEFGDEDSSFYHETFAGLRYPTFQGWSEKLVGNPKINYLMFIDNDMAKVIDGEYYFDSTKAKPYDVTVGGFLTA